MQEPTIAPARQGTDQKTLIRNVQLSTLHMLHEVMTLEHRAIVQFHKTGKVIATESNVALQYTPDAMRTAALSESIRRLSTGLIEQPEDGIQKKPDSLDDLGLMPAAIEYIRRLSTMTPDQIEDEIHQLDAMRRVVRSDRVLTRETVDDYDPYEENTSYPLSRPNL